MSKRGWISVALAAGIAIGARARHPLLMPGVATIATLWILSGPVQQGLPLVDPNKYARKRDLEKVDHIADVYDVDRHDLGKAVEEAKRELGRYKGSRAPDLTKKEIEELAKQLPKKK